MYRQLLSTTGVNRKAGADPRNSKTTAKRTCLKHLKIKTTTIRIHTLIGKAEEGAGEGGGRKGGGGGEETPSTLKVPQGLSTRPLWLCHAFKISNAMIMWILYVYGTSTISY